MGVGWVALLVGARIDCWHTHTGLSQVTDTGLKAFSAALGSSTTITTVDLSGKFACLVFICVVRCVVVVHAGVFGLRVDVVWCGAVRGGLWCGVV